MKIGYKTNKLKKQLSTPTEIKKSYGNMAKMVSRRLDEIVASPTLKVLQQLPGPNCHALKGDRDGQWAVNISGNYRLIFEIDHDPVPLNEDGSINSILVTDICILETTDYHNR